MGASQVRETQLEARMQAEIKKLSTEVESLKEASSRGKEKFNLFHYSLLKCVDLSEQESINLAFKCLL